MLKDKLQTRRVSIEVEIAMFRRNQLVKETILLEEIQKNNIKEQEIQKELENKDRQAWEDNRVVYIKGKIYVLNNWKIQKQILQKNHELANVKHPG